LGALVGVVLMLLGCCNRPGVAPITSPPASASPTARPSLTSSPSPTATQTPLPTATPSPTLTSTPPIPTSTPIPAPAQFEAAGCRFRLPPAETVECGFLIVPRDRSRPTGPTIRLHVAVVKSHSQRPATDPVLYLEGGPGGHALDGLVWNIEHLQGVLADRDFIVFDQRGVGHSEPLLDCPEVAELFFETLDQNLSREERVARQLEAQLACRDRLLDEGVDLTAYNSAASAADVNDLRLALGYDEWNVYGVSYGARLALTVMRDFPSGVRSAILDSTLPLQVDSEAERAANTGRVLDQLFGGCAADAECKVAFPNLEATFYQLIEQLDARAIPVQMRHPLTGEQVNGLINGDDMIVILVNLLYDAHVIPWLPTLIADTNQGDYSLLSEYLGRLLAGNDFLSEGMGNSVHCGEEVRFSSLESAASAAGVHPRLREYLLPNAQIVFALCEAWGAKEADPIENKAVVSNIPTLVLAGEYDPITPPAWGLAAAETLTQVYYLTFPAVGHGALTTDPCARAVVDVFLDNPNAAPRPDCLANLATLDFITR